MPDTQWCAWSASVANEDVIGARVSFLSVFFYKGKGRKQVWKTGKDFPGKWSNGNFKGICRDGAYWFIKRQRQGTRQKTKQTIDKHITYIYIYRYTHTHIHIYTHTHIQTYIHTYLHTYIPTYLHTYLPTYIHTYIDILMYIISFQSIQFICICIYIYIHVYIIII